MALGKKKLYLLWRRLELLLLLAGGKTAHSRFGIPLKLMADSSCHVKSRSDLAKMLRYVQAIIWHEAPMMSTYAVECVDRLLR